MMILAHTAPPLMKATHSAPLSHRPSELAGMTSPAEAIKTRSEPIIGIENLGFSYDLGETETLRGLSLEIPKNEVTAFIGPSGCGKSTLLRCLNRMNDLIPTAKVTRGAIRILGQEIHAPGVDPIELRKQVGMVFQKYNPFPKSIYENVACGLRIQGMKKKLLIDETVERALRRAALWEEVKDRLTHSALGRGNQVIHLLFVARSLERIGDLAVNLGEEMVFIESAEDIRHTHHS